jgi:hypothetical protein
MKTYLTNETVFNIVYLLKTKYPDLEKFDKRFNFAVTRTLACLQPIAADILRARESGLPKFKEFEEKKLTVINAYQTSGGFNSDEDKQNCQDEVNRLSEEYKETLEERIKEINIYNEILGQEVEVDIIQCKFESLPDDFNFDILRVFVKETDSEIEDLI